MNENKTGYWLGMGAKIILAAAMLLYLGMHSYNFFTFTFKGDQWLFAILGLFTTSIGFLLWLAVYMFAAEDGLERAVALVMMFVSLGGEFAVAGFDMYMNISGQLATTTWTAEDLRSMSYIIAGLALVNGLALVADIAGKRIVADLASVKWPKRKTEQAPTPVVALASDVELAKSINPLAAPYRACPNCDGLVPLTALHCSNCGTKMPTLDPTPAARRNGKA
jgi:hypothetical protein